MKLKHLKLSLFLLILTALFTGCSHEAASDPILTSTPKPSPSPNITGAPASTPTPTVPLQPSATPTALPSSSVSLTPGSAEVSALPGSSDYTQTARTILDGMTLEEKIGQLFFVRCRSDKALEDIKTYYPGGFILFSPDFENRSKQEVIAAIKSYQSTSALPMLIGVDEEGGTVNRVSKYPEFRVIPFQSPQDLYRQGGFNQIIRDTKEKSELLKSLGINVNLAPVCDVSTDPKDFIYPRSFGKDAEQTSKYVKTVVTIMNQEGLGCTLKHFPGYGNNVDTHTGISIDNRSYDSFTKNDFLPFEAGIDVGAGSILVSHNIVTSMDPDYPASLSPKVHEILRDELDFQGVIMTDDLSMDAIKQYTGDKEAAVQAILAGNDLLIATDFDVQIPAVINAVKAHTISEEMIDQAVIRILLWKLSLGLIQ